YLKEDLESPWTKEIAMFQAFAEVVEKSDDEIKDFRSVDKFTCLNQQRLILKLFVRRHCREKERSLNQKKVRQVVSITSNHIFLRDNRLCFRTFSRYSKPQCYTAGDLQSNYLGIK